MRSHTHTHARVRIRSQKLKNYADFFVFLPPAQMPSFDRDGVCTGSDDSPDQQTEPNRHGMAGYDPLSLPLSGAEDHRADIASHIHGKMAHAAVAEGEAA